MMKRRRLRTKVFCVLLWFPMVFFAAVDQREAVFEPEEKLKTAVGEEKIILLNETAGRYASQGRYRQAGDYFEAALETAKKNEAKEWVRDIYKSLYEMYEAAGDYKKAVEYHEEFIRAKDAILKQKNSDQLALMQDRYETKKKENELQLLRQTAADRRLIKIFLVIAVLLSLAALIFFHNLFFTRKRANRLLQLSERKYRALFSFAGDAILLLQLRPDPSRTGGAASFLIEDCSIIDCNQRALDMFAVSREEISDCGFFDFSPAQQPDKRDSRQQAMERIRDALAGNPQRFSWQHIKKDGTPMDTIVSLTAITIDKQKLIQAIVHDITNRKQLEDERVKLARLEPVGLLAGGIAHDFNNLLAVILGNLELAQMEAVETDGVMPFLQRMEQAVSEAADLAGKFRTIAEQGIHPKETMSIGESLAQAARSVLSKWSSGVRYRIDIPEYLWPVQCDLEQIRHAAGNLILNALYAVDTGSAGRIQLKAGNVELKKGEVPLLPPGPYVLISITDNGRGIAGENLPKVFDPYFINRGEAARRGLGLGLAVAQAIIKGHNGAIDVSSKEGETTFRIYLPAHNGGRETT